MKSKRKTERVCRINIRQGDEQKKREKIKVLKRVGIPLSEYKELNTKEALN